jgi:hypothetical protein
MKSFNQHITKDREKLKEDLNKKKDEKLEEDLTDILWAAAAGAGLWGIGKAWDKWGKDMAAELYPSSFFLWQKVAQLPYLYPIYPKPYLYPKVRPRQLLPKVCPLDLLLIFHLFFCLDLLLTFHDLWLYVG